MKTLHLLLVTILLLALQPRVFSSNPDSEIVQDSSEDNKEDDQDPDLMQNTNSSETSDGNDERKTVSRSSNNGSGHRETRLLTPEGIRFLREFNVTRIRLMRPIKLGTETIWREVGINVKHFIGRNPSYNVSGDFGINLPYPLRPTDNRGWTDFNQDGQTRSNGNTPLFSNDNIPPIRPKNDQGYNANNPSAPGNRVRRPPPSRDVPYRRGGYNTQGGRNRYVPFITENPNRFKPNPNAPNRNTPANVPSNRFPVVENPQITFSNPSQTTWLIPQPTTPTGLFPSPPRRKISSDSNFFAGIVNDFAFKLVEAWDSESNFVISPLSIFIALSMCYLGSDGNTESQIERALGLDENAVHGENLHKGMMDLISLIDSDSSGYQLFVATGMFLGQEFTVNAEFDRTIREYYNAELGNIDFRNPTESVSAINDWVSRRTRNMIPSLISKPLPLATQLLLLNAVYFKGIWKTEFPVDLTYSGIFHSPYGSRSGVPTMALYGETFPFYRDEETRHSFIKLPYAGDQVSMIIALPDNPDEDPMPGMRDRIFCYVRDALKNTKLGRVAIPKFKLENLQSLRGPLQQLGVRDIFNSEVVDLRKLRKENDVHVSDILHKAVIEVNEEGTTAAASTGVKFVPLSLRNSTEFIANRPFAFYILHEPSGLVLFHGKIFDLEGSGNVPQ